MFLKNKYSLINRKDNIRLSEQSTNRKKVRTTFLLLPHYADFDPGPADTV